MFQFLQLTRSFNFNLNKKYIKYRVKEFLSYYYRLTCILVAMMMQKQPANRQTKPAVKQSTATSSSASQPDAPESRFVLTNKKCIEFYTKNPHIDFNRVNEMYIDLFQKLISSEGNIYKIDEMKNTLLKLDKRLSDLDNNINQNNTMIKMMHDNLNNNRDFYTQQIKSIIQEKENDPTILKLIREANETWTQKSILTITEMIPKINGNVSQDISKIIHEQQQKLLDESNAKFQSFLDDSNKHSQPEILEKMIQNNYDTISNKLLNTFQPFFNQESTFHKNNVELMNFLDKQNNSTLKGKISEEKLEHCLNNAFPCGSITDKSGAPKSCDYLLERNDYSAILFENKDYTNNVPNEEVKKFIRDIEHNKKDGIMLSQNSGIANKNNYNIDIHDGHIMVFVHNVKYDESKIRVAVNLVDHLRQILDKYKTEKEELVFSKDDMLAINKEYLTFIDQRNNLIETYKKNYKEHLKQLESFEMPLLIKLLDSIFTNVEQLTYTCQYCKVYNAKNKRALTTHQNKCKKSIVNLDDEKTNVVVNN